MRNQKIWPLLLSVAVIACMIASCSNKGDASQEKPESIVSTDSKSGSESASSTESASSSDSPSAESTAELTLPIVTPGSLTLKVATVDNFYAPNSYAQNLPVYQEIEKRTGIKIEWDVASSALYNEAMITRLAAGKDLPDLLYIPAAYPPVTAGKDGLVIDMAPLIEQYAPDIKRFLDVYPEIANQLKTADGNIYAVGQVVEGAVTVAPFGLIANAAWLKKLGLEEPKTLDDWYTVLKAFKERDPNGNGLKDEIPFSPQYDLAGLALLGSSYGFHPQFSKGFYPDAQGTLQYDWLRPEAREFMTLLNKFYKEGLIDPNYMTRSLGTEIFSDISKDIIGMTSGYISNLARNASAQKEAGIEDADWSMIAPPSRPGHDSFYEMLTFMGAGRWGISKDAKDPVATIKFLDYVFAHEEGLRISMFGVEGLSYTMENGKPKFTEWVTNNPDGLASIEALRSLGAVGNLPYIRAGKWYDTAEFNELDKIASPKTAENAKYIEQFLVPSLVLGIATEEETEQYNLLWTDVEAYLKESLAQFVKGEKSIENEWGNFTATLRSMGMDTILEIKQAQYDRAN